MESSQEWDASMSTITLAQGVTMLYDAKSHCITCQETLVDYKLQPWNAQ